MQRHDFAARHPDNALASSCTMCGRPRENEIHEELTLDIPETLAELRQNLLEIRAFYSVTSREYLTLTVAHGALEPNE